MNDVVCKHGWSRSFCEPCSSAHIISQLKGPRDMGMLAIKPEMVPDKVWMAARLELVDGPIREDMEDRYRHAIAAALNAWPGMEIHPTHAGYPAWPHIILPIPQEDSNDQ